MLTKLNRNPCGDQATKVPSSLHSTPLANLLSNRSAIEASQLREKTAVMAERIHQLEEALAVAHAKTSTDVHTLLVQTEEGQKDRSADQPSQSNSSNNDVIDAFGTLSIGSDGRTKYHNQSAGADVSSQASIFHETTFD